MSNANVINPMIYGDSGVKDKVKLLYSARRASQHGVYQSMSYTTDKDYKLIIASASDYNGNPNLSINGGKTALSTTSECYNGPSGKGYTVTSKVAYDVPKGTRISSVEYNANHLHVFGIEK